MAGPSSTRPVVALAVALPVLLALVLVTIGLVTRGDADPAAAPPDTDALSLDPVDAPDASAQACADLLARLPATLPSDRGDLPPREVTPPVAGARVWAASPEPVVLRCGVARPPALGPASPLLAVNTVSWLPLPDPAGTGSSTTYAVVDRSVYLTLRAPAEAGSGPLQRVSDVVAATLPASPVRVR